VDDLIELEATKVNKLHEFSTELFLRHTCSSSSFENLEGHVNIETGSMNLIEQTPSGKYPFYTRNIGSFFSDRYTHDATGVIVAGEGNFAPKFVSGKFGLHQRAYFISSKDSSISAPVIYEAIKSNVKYLNSVAVGSTVKSLRRFCFEKMPLPAGIDYSKLSHELNPIYKQILVEEEKQKQLKKAKRLLLSKYF
jgi:type I restriction enzyme S subunit